MNAFNWREFVQPFIAVPKLSEVRGVETADWVMVPGDSVATPKPKTIKTHAQLMAQRARKNATYQRTRASRVGA